MNYYKEPEKFSLREKAKYTIRWQFNNFIIKMPQEQFNIFLNHNSQPSSPFHFLQSSTVLSPECLTKSRHSSFHRLRKFRIHDIRNWPISITTVQHSPSPFNSLSMRATRSDDSGPRGEFSSLLVLLPFLAMVFGSRSRKERLRRKGFGEGCGILVRESSPGKWRLWQSGVVGLDVIVCFGWSLNLNLINFCYLEHKSGRNENNEN